MVKRSKKSQVKEKNTAKNKHTQSDKANVTQTANSHLTFSQASGFDCTEVIEHVYRRQVAAHFAGHPKIPNGPIPEAATISGVFEPT